MKCVSIPLRALVLTFLLGLSAGSPSLAQPSDSPKGEAAKPAAANPRPSLLLVTIDTIRADRVGAYGYAEARTPNLDALARAGVRFDNALSPVPLTVPSHATMLTGLVPRHHGVRDNSFKLVENVSTLAESFQRAGYDTAAFVSAAVLDRRTGLDRGFRIYDDTVRVGDRRAFNYEERAASQTNEAVFARLGELKPPFFLWVHYFDPHLPYVPPEPYRSEAEGRPYDGEIAFVDAQFGLLRDKVLASSGPLIIAVAGDHGESLGEHQEDSHGVFVYQATQRVPLILAGNKIPSGKVVSENVGLVDLAPTLLETLLVDSPKGLDGTSLVPTLHGKGSKRAYELESFFPNFAFGWSPLRALVHGRFKYIDAPEAELYDLRTDPGEETNLIAMRSQDAGILSRRLAELVGDDRPERPPLDAGHDDHMARLEALGYVDGSDVDRGDGRDDPKVAIGRLKRLNDARRLLQSGDSQGALDILTPLTAEDPDNGQALLTKVQAHLGLGQIQAAIGAATQATQLRPEDPLAHFNLANALASRPLDDTDAQQRARLAYQETLRLNPRYAEAYLNFTSFLRRTNDLDGARQLVAQAAEYGVEDPDLETQRGLLALQQGNLEATRDAFARALRLNPCAPGVEEALGRLAYKESDFREAAVHYRQAFRCEPRPDLAMTLGSIYMLKLSEPDAARDYYTQALAMLPPGHPEAASLREILSGL